MARESRTTVRTLADGYAKYLVKLIMEKWALKCIIIYKDAILNIKMYLCHKITEKQALQWIVMMN